VRGDDRLVAGHRAATISGGPGWDAIVGRNGVRDHISCGPGDDIVWADQLDVIASDCEVVIRATVSLPTKGSPRSPRGLEPPRGWPGVHGRWFDHSRAHFLYSGVGLT